MEKKKKIHNEKVKLYSNTSSTTRREEQNQIPYDKITKLGPLAS
jgi:hypothetical protein